MKYLIVWYQKVTIGQNLIRDGKTQYIQLYDNKNKQEINKKNQHNMAYSKLYPFLPEC